MTNPGDGKRSPACWLLVCVVALAHAGCGPGNGDDAGTMGTDAARPDTDAARPDAGCTDSDGDGVCDGDDVCDGSDDGLDADGDTVPDGCDVCATGDDRVDTDNDTVPDGCDVCATGDDRVDTDGDGIPNACDTCVGTDTDTDGDGVADACDICAGSDDNVDADSDGVPDGCDACAGSDDRIDSDSDGTPDGCDRCAGSNDSDDADADGIPDGCDICALGDDAVDADADGVPDACDACAGGDDADDFDADGTPDACDGCGIGRTLSLGPMLYWRLGDDPATLPFVAPDLSGNSRTGVYGGTIARLRGLSEDADYSTDLAASDARLETRFDGSVSGTTAGGFPVDELTVSFAVRYSGTSLAHFVSYAALDSGGGLTDNELLIGQDATSFFLYVGGVRARFAESLTAGRFTHVVITRDAAGLIQLYLDGVAASTVTDATTLDDGGVLILGQDQDTLGGGFDANQDTEGALDELALFDRALSGVEVRAIFDTFDCSETSCATHVAAEPGATDGLFRVDPDGPGIGVDPRAVHCDMAFDDGTGRGWTLIVSSQAMGVDALTAGAVDPVTPTTAAFVERPFAQALAVVSEQVHVRDPGAMATDSITSIPGELPIQNLRAGLILNEGSSMTASDSALAYWTGPLAVVRNLWHDCPTSSRVYPSTYWACGNSDGAHLVDSLSTFEHGNPNQPMDVYVH